MMDPDRMACHDSEEEDWMDTHWDTIKESTSNKKEMESRTNTDTMQKGDDSPREGAAPLMSRMQLNDHKAGMQGLNKQHINHIIYEVSKGSRFFENEQRKEEQVQQRIQEQEKHRQAITDAELQRGVVEADKMIEELKGSRDLSQTIVHVDMDAFFAAVEMRDNPALHHKPMAVGGIGMLSTSNYEARKYGVRAAMPGYIGKKLCPQLVIVPPNFDRYTQVSQQVREIFVDYDPNFFPMSLDEAYLNFTQHILTRPSLPPWQRSFIKRCQTPADAQLCRCDLNTTIRDCVLKELDKESGWHSVLESSQKHADVNAKSNLSNQKVGIAGTDSHELDTPRTVSHKLHTLEMETGMVDTVENDTIRVHSQETYRWHCETEHKSLDSGAAEIVSSLCQPVGRESSGLQQGGRHSSEPSSTAEQCADGQGTGRGHRQVDSGRLCPCCGKAIPAYDVVTFGVDVESAVQEMRCRIEQRTCLTASAGIAPNMMLSKVCSDQNKPNGQFFLPASCEVVQQFVHNLPVRKISGIGHVTEQMLGALGISRCCDLLEKRALLYHLYSPVSFSYFMRVACGIGSTEVARASEEERKSMSTEHTFGELSHPEDLYSKCLELCQSLAQDLAREQLMGKTISLKLKTTDFQVRTRAQTISNYINDVDGIFSVAKGILRNEIQAEAPRSLRLRLMGVRMSKLVAESDCPQEKQNTILGFFKKTASGSAKTPRDMHRLDSISRNNFNPSLAETWDSPDMKIQGRREIENQTSGISSKNVEERVFAEGVVIKEAHSYNVSETSAVYPSSSRGDRDSQTGRPGHEEVMMNSSTATDYMAGPAVCENSVCKTRDEQYEITTTNDSIQENWEGDCSEVSHTQGTIFNDCAGQKRASSEVSHAQYQPVNSCASGRMTPDSEPSLSRVTNIPGPSHGYSEDMHRLSTSSNSYHWEDEIKSSNTDLASVIHTPFSVTEPFTCPVCCKPVNCINLMDFNAHIDRCLQPDSKLAAVSQNPSSKTSTTSKTSLSQTSSSEKYKSIRVNINKCPPGVKPSAESKKQRGGTGSKAVAGSTNYVVSQPRCPILDEGVCIGVEKRTEPAVSSSFQSEAEICVSSSPDCVDYMVCPLCGAERADWTLDTFNQHVDTCLNRDTIAQILREQHSSEDQPRKRHASSYQEEQRASQNSKKAKKSQSPRAERSILSFFKR